ncbi:MAG: hypothetical protein P4L99_24110 [Chthoniobacter sp.]|nr:hypothetical protein [Chthoniobacter sp.]
MSAPVIDPESSILSYPQWLTWEHQFSATNSPVSWAITGGGFPSGMTFEPAWNVSISDSGDTVNLTNHGFANGTLLVFSAIPSGGGGLTTGTRYYVVNAAADTFQLASALGGAAIAITSDAATATLYRPGYLSGAATVPGISTVRLTATNADPATSAEVLFTIGIEAAAAVPDSNADLIWDMATGSIIAQTSATLNLTPADRATPILFVKEQDDLIARLRVVKSGSVLDLAMADNAMKLVLKELEPENQVVVSDLSTKIGSGDGTSYLVHAKFDSAALAASLSNYEQDSGTFYNALAEIELTFGNPTYGAFGPEFLVRTSRTFTIQIERDLGEA